MHSRIEWAEASFRAPKFETGSRDLKPFCPFLFARPKPKNTQCRAAAQRGGWEINRSRRWGDRGWKTGCGWLGRSEVPSGLSHALAGAQQPGPPPGDSRQAWFSPTLEGRGSQTQSGAVTGDPVGGSWTPFRVSLEAVLADVVLIGTCHLPLYSLVRHVSGGRHLIAKLICGFSGFQKGVFKFGFEMLLALKKIPILN